MLVNINVASAEAIEVLGKEASKIAAPTKSTNQTELIERLIRWSDVSKVRNI